MHKIEGTTITLTRGDTLFIELEITKDGEAYVPAEGDKIRFAMKMKYKDPDADVLINKQIPTDTLTLELEPEDTKTLPMGKDYVYDIEFTDADGHVDTFVKGVFHLDEEVI